jgi:eukaryotic-like serine/threonine-protein kinase
MKIDTGTVKDVTLVSEGQDGPREPAPNPGPDPCVRARDPKAPQTPVEGDLVADRYRVGPVIGAGGMGIVYKATHVELGTSVALKVIRPDIARNSSIWRRFSREARALGALSNKHVVRVNDAGTLASGLRYLVMELLEGIDLRRLLQEHGAPPRARAVDYVIQVCSALGDAHRLNIIHRDVKPENIFIANVRGSEPEVKLLDFGVALFLEDAGQLTVPGRGVGSPQYLSPEQMQNPSGVDQRSDIWAVGLLLYELLSGLSPFHGLNPAQTGMLISKGPIPRLDQTCPDLPRPLLTVVQRCLEIEPSRRPQSADELIQALAPFSSAHEAETRDAAARSVAPPKKVGIVPRLFGLRS